jgi:hypothetical protein
MIETRKTYLVDGLATPVKGPWVRDYHSTGPHAEATARGYASAGAREVFDKGHASAVIVETTDLNDQGEQITVSLVIPAARIVSISVEVRTV